MKKIINLLILIPILPATVSAQVNPNLKVITPKQDFGVFYQSSLDLAPINENDFVKKRPLCTVEFLTDIDITFNDDNKIPKKFTIPKGTVTVNNSVTRLVKKEQDGGIIRDGRFLIRSLNIPVAKTLSEKVVNGIHEFVSIDCDFTITSMKGAISLSFISGNSRGGFTPTSSNFTPDTQYVKNKWSITGAALGGKICINFFEAVGTEGK